MKKVICFDLDNTLCKTKGTDYKNATPIKKKIIFVNYLAADYKIIIFTARFMGREKGNLSRAKRRGFAFTKYQLKKWGVKFDKLIFGKPTYDIFIDDKNLGYNKNWIVELRKKLKIK
jgi:hypothetical protein